MPFDEVSADRLNRGRFGHGCPTFAVPFEPAESFGPAELAGQDIVSDAVSKSGVGQSASTLFGLSGVLLPVSLIGQIVVGQRLGFHVERGREGLHDRRVVLTLCVAHSGPPQSDMSASQCGPTLAA